MVGDQRQLICILAGTPKVVVGRTQDKLPKGSYMVEATDDDNLPSGVSVNHTYVNPTISNFVKHQFIQHLDPTSALCRNYLGCQTQGLGL